MNQAHDIMNPCPCRKEKEEVLTTGRCVSPTDAAMNKAKEASSESVFSAALLPCSFCRSFLQAHSVKAVCLGSNLTTSTLKY